MMDEATEYDLETFLDEYQPLFGYKNNASVHQSSTTKNVTRLEQFKRRYFSDSKFVNSKLSKMKKRTVIFRKRNKSKGTTTTTTEVGEDSLTSVITTTTTTTTDNVTVTRSEVTVDESQDKGGVREVREEIKITSEVVTDELAVDNDDDDDNENEDEDMKFFTNDDKRSRGRKYHAFDKATTFVRNHAKVFRKRPLKNRCLKEQKTENTNKTVENENDKTVTAKSINTYNASNDDISSNIKPKNRYLWNNARKRMDYVVSFIRKKDDDQVLLMEGDGDDDEISSVQIKRSQSCSDILGSTRNNNNHLMMNSNSALNKKYLSANVRQLESRASSHANSRRSSLDSNNEPINDFLSQQYLKKSQSQHSISSVPDDKQRDFEQCFFHADDFEYDGDLQCVQNNLYGSDNDLGKTEFVIAEHEYNDVIDEEVNNYIDDCDTKNRSRSLKQQNEMLGDVGESSLPNIKHTSTYSYSVNDLYELFNKEHKFKNIEASFDGLVV